MQTRLPYKPGEPVPFLADETAESMRGFIRDGDIVSSPPPRALAALELERRRSLTRSHCSVCL